MQLTEVPIGEEVLVAEVLPGTVGEGRRLEDLGFVPGTRSRAERRAPMGDPTIYELRGARIALRRDGAALVTVEPVDG